MEMIQNAKDSKEALLKLKEEFPGKRKQEIEKIEKEMEDHRDRSIRVKKLESERRLEIETTIKSHDAMFEFFKQDNCRLKLPPKRSKRRNTYVKSERL